jgi:lipoprotein NlpI
LQDFQHAIALKPFYLDAYYNQGNLYHELKQFDNALDSLNQVIRMKAGYALAHFSRGNVFHETKQYPPPGSA